MSTPPRTANVKQAASLCPSSIRSVADLKQLQRVMAAALFRPLTRTDDMQPCWNATRSTSDVVSEFIKPNDRLTAFERLEIYNRQYWYRVLDCLYDDYPGLRALLGQRRFSALCQAYLAKYPSASWTLRNLGQRLAPFIAEEPAYAGPKLAAAIDIVRFEWAQVLAFDEAKKKPLALESLLGGDATLLRLGLQPYLSLIEVNHAVDTYFMAVRKQDSGMRSETSNALDHAPKRAAFKRIAMPKRGKIYLAVHRCETEVYFKRLPREAFLALTALQAGEPLGTALDHALATADPAQDWAIKIREWFQEWAALEWFCKAG